MLNRNLFCACATTPAVAAAACAKAAAVAVMQTQPVLEARQRELSFCGWETLLATIREKLQIKVVDAL